MTARPNLVLWTAICICTATGAHAQVATALLREDAGLDGLDPAETINSIGNVSVNNTGGFAFGFNTSDGTTLSRFWGTADGTAPTLLRTEATIGDFQQTAFEGFYGIADDGSICYGTTATRTSDMTTGLDGVWRDDTPLLTEEDAVADIPGFFSTFNSRPTATANGECWWVGGISDSLAGATQQRVLFRQRPGGGPTAVLRSGDNIGLPEVIDNGGSPIDFDFSVSASGTSYLLQTEVASTTADDGVVVRNGDVLQLDGAPTRENSPVPGAIGGLAGELWDNFDFFATIDTGEFMFTGDTDADTAMDEFICKNGQIILREGTGLTFGGQPAIVSGAIEGADMNESGDWGAIWDIDLGADNLECLIVNGDVVLVETDTVDWDGDGAIDASDNNGTIANFTGISNLAIGARVGGRVAVYFTADIDFAGTSSSSDDLEGGFCLSLDVGGCVCETTADETVDVSDLLAFLELWFGGAPEADLDGGGVGVTDLLTFLACWFPASGGTCG